MKWAASQTHHLIQTFVKKICQWNCSFSFYVVFLKLLELIFWWNYILSQVIKSSLLFFCLFVCLFHDLILLYRKQSFIIRHSERKIYLLNLLPIVQFWESYIRKEAMVIQVKLNGNWQAIPNTYRQGQDEGNIQERVL